MRPSKAYRSAALWLGFLLLLYSCSPLSRRQPEEREARNSNETTKQAKEQSALGNNETAKQAQEQFALGRYKNALDIYSSAYDKHHDADLRRGYARLGEQTKAAADVLFQAGNFGEAGIIYRNLFDSDITTRDFARELSFNDVDLIKKMEACSKSLMEIGLMRYREEKLEEAIAVWRKVLVFDAENKNVRNAIDTATLQLQQLKTLR